MRLGLRAGWRLALGRMCEGLLRCLGVGLAKAQVLKLCSRA